MLGATVEVGAGRVFVYHNDRVLYVSQWDGTGLSDDCRVNDLAHAWYDVYPLVDYQVAPFWYNALSWAGSDPAVSIWPTLRSTSSALGALEVLALPRAL